MELFLIPFPDIDPVALDLGYVQLRWYGLSYMFGILFGWLYIRSLVANHALWGKDGSPITQNHIDDLLLWVTIAIIFGGRLGYVLFYNPAYFAAHPVDIFKPWQGGMSFHGGLLGTIIAIALFARKYALPTLSILDVVAAAQPIGQFFGRIANFVNGELWGRPTDVPWAMIFPHPDAGGVPRHPSQLYEAFLEGLVLFFILRYLTHNRHMLKSPGFVGGAFVLGYGTARIFVEFFRQYEVGSGLMIGFLTPGMLYSIPMLFLGLFFMRNARKNMEQGHA